MLNDFDFADKSGSSDPKRPSISREREDVASPVSQNNCMLPLPPRSPSAGGRVLLPRIRGRAKGDDGNAFFPDVEDKGGRPGRTSALSNSLTEPPREACFSPPVPANRGGGSRMSGGKHGENNITAYSVTAQLPKRPQSVKSLQPPGGSRGRKFVYLLYFGSSLSLFHKITHKILEAEIN